ncbi:hypothetical protein ACEWY4_018218 [Coilia grayii]|uniref:Bulb-type lectin domain-containing protein n=1 Tax=Coilia grayii TaxID=363190 RepID=A0ABD1JK64_9TELE
MSRNVLPGYGVLQKGDYLLSNNRNFKAIFQDDGNFVIYTWKPIWASNTGGCRNADRVVMQGDCNLVMYSNSDNPLWAAGTNRCGGPYPGVHAVLQDDGALVVQNTGEQLWSSK